MKKVNINSGKVQPVNKIWLGGEEPMAFSGVPMTTYAKSGRVGKYRFVAMGEWYGTM